MLTLPSGLGLPIGSMIVKMRRNIILDQYFQVRWGGEGGWGEGMGREA